MLCYVLASSCFSLCSLILNPKLLEIKSLTFLCVATLLLLPSGLLSNLSGLWLPIPSPPSFLFFSYDPCSPHFPWLSSDCQFEISGWDGVVRSSQVDEEERVKPGDALDCIWTIRAPPNSKVSIRVCQSEKLSFDVFLEYCCSLFFFYLFGSHSEDRKTYSRIKTRQTIYYCIYGLYVGLVQNTQLRT